MMKGFTNLLDRFRPARWQVEEPMPAAGRTKLFAQVEGRNDPCLKAVVSLLGEIMEQNAAVAFNVKATPEVRLLACDYAAFARETLHQIEDELSTARERLEKTGKS